MKNWAVMQKTQHCLPTSSVQRRYLPPTAAQFEIGQSSNQEPDNAEPTSTKEEVTLDHKHRQDAEAMQLDPNPTQGAMQEGPADVPALLPAQLDQGQQPEQQEGEEQQQQLAGDEQQEQAEEAEQQPQAAALHGTEGFIGMLVAPAAPMPILPELPEMQPPLPAQEEQLRHSTRLKSKPTTKLTPAVLMQKIDFLESGEKSEE